MYTVIGNPKTRTSRVLWMLEEIGEDYRIIPASPHSPEVKAINPSGKVPVLVDGDLSIIDSIAICNYLADKHGKATHPAGTAARALQDSFLHFALDDLENPLWTMAKHSFVLPKEHRVPAVKESCRFEIANAMANLERRLGDKAYASGDKFTIADLVIGHCAGWAEMAGLEMPGGRLGAYFAKIRARPARLRAVERGQSALDETAS